VISGDVAQWGRGKAAAALIIVAVLAGAVRFGYLDGFTKSPFAETPLGEAAANANLAESIATTGSLGEEAYSRPPLYPILLSLLSKAEDEALAYRRAQAVSGVVIACLVFLGGCLLLGTAGGLISGLICALYGPSIHWGAQLVPAIVLTLLFTCYWLICIAGSKRRSIALWLVAGLFVGAMAGLKTGTFVLLVPAILIVLNQSKFFGRARAIAAILLLILGATIAVTPFMAHNWKAGAPGIVIAANSGTALYMANNPHATGLAPGLAGENTWWHGDRYAETEATLKSES
jgi:4-amino-4-deoxy-L-arabinose transferase-like glycosyltransferase